MDAEFDAYDLAAMTEEADMPEEIAAIPQMSGDGGDRLLKFRREFQEACAEREPMGYHWKMESVTTELAATAAAAAETNYCSIAGKLLGLHDPEKLLEEPHRAKLRSEMGIDVPFPTSRPEVKAASGGGDGFMTKVAAQAIGAMLFALFGAFTTPADLEPHEKAAGAVGLMSVMAGMVLQDKKRGLSRAMLKFGSVAIAVAMLAPMAGTLPTLLSWIFGVLAVAIVAVTVTFA